MLPNVLHNRRVSVLPPASRTPPVGRGGGLRAEGLPAQLVAAVVPQAAVGDRGRGGVAPAMRAPPGELVRVRTAAPPSTGRRTSRWPRTRGSRSRGARWGGSRRGRPRRTCATAGLAVRDDPGGAAPAPARGVPGRREHRPRARGPRLLVLSRAAMRKSSASTPPDSTSETLRSRHGAAQAPRHEGRRALQDPYLGGEPQCH